MTWGALERLMQEPLVELVAQVSNQAAAGRRLGIGPGPRQAL